MYNFIQELQDGSSNLICCYNSPRAPESITATIFQNSCHLWSSIDDATRLLIDYSILLCALKRRCAIHDQLLVCSKKKTRKLLWDWLIQQRHYMHNFCHKSRYRLLNIGKQGILIVWTKIHLIRRYRIDSEIRSAFIGNIDGDSVEDMCAHKRARILNSHWSGRDRRYNRQTIARHLKRMVYAHMQIVYIDSIIYFFLFSIWNVIAMRMCICMKSLGTKWTEKKSRKNIELTTTKLFMVMKWTHRNGVNDKIAREKKIAFSLIDYIAMNACISICQFIGTCFKSKRCSCLCLHWT